MTCCEGSMGHVARAPWDMSQGLHGTFCKGSMGDVERALHNSWIPRPRDLSA